MRNQNSTYTNNDSYEAELNGYDMASEEEFGGFDGEFGVDEYEGDFIEDIDFSEFKGKSFKSNLHKVKKVVAKKNRAKKPSTKEFFVKKRATLYGKANSRGEVKTTKRIIVPSTQKVIIEGVDKFILGEDKCGVKDIGYYKCKKLEELVFTMNNNSGNDFDVELFNPSQPLDYLYSMSGNINNKIQVAGGVVSYTDVLFNILGNPMHIVNAKFTFAGASYLNQINQPLIFQNKRATGEQRVEPFQLQLQVDNMQVANDIVFFDLNTLGRPFIPNGMDIIKYKVLAGNTVTFAFYYRQKDLRKLFYDEANNNKKLL